MALHRGPKIITDGLVLCLDAADRKSYPGSGSIWYDRSGNSQNATLVNSPTFSSSYGGIFSFNGINNYLSFANQMSVSLSTGFSMGLWFKVPSSQINASAWNYILSDRDTGGTPSSHPGDYEIGIYSTNTTTFLFKDNVASPNTISSFLGSASWNYILFGQNSSLNPFIYKNGVLSSSSEATYGNTTFEFSYLFTRETISNFFQCDCAIIQLYNKALSSNEILQNFNAQRYRFGV